MQGQMSDVLFKLLLIEFIESSFELWIRPEGV